MISRNIFITQQQRVALGDFSQVKLIRGNINFSRSKTNKKAFGTECYLAPEVIAEIGDFQKSPAIDIW